jgi:hypothetical protein
MKKLVHAFQILAIVALCPVYIVLEMTHVANATSENSSGSLIKMKTEVMSTRLSQDTKNKAQNATVDYLK